MSPLIQYITRVVIFWSRRMEMLFQYRKVQPAQLKPPPLVEIHPMVSNILVDQVETVLMMASIM